MVESSESAEQQMQEAIQYMWCSIQELNLHNIKVLLDHNFAPNQPLNQLGLSSLHYAATSQYP